MLTISVVSFCWIFLKQSIAQNFYCVWTTLHLTPHLQRKGEDTKITSGGSYFLHLLPSSSEATTTKCVWQSLNFLSALFREVPPATPWGQVVVGMRARFVKRTMTFVYLFLFFLCAWPFVWRQVSPFWQENRQTVVKWGMKVLHNNILPLIRLPPRATIGVAT